MGANSQGGVIDPPPILFIEYAPIIIQWKRYCKLISKLNNDVITISCIIQSLNLIHYTPSPSPSLNHVPPPTRTHIRIQVKKWLSSHPPSQQIESDHLLAGSCDKRFLWFNFELSAKPAVKNIEASPHVQR